MKAVRIKLVLFALSAVALLFTNVSAADDATKVKGLIVARDGAKMNVKGEIASWTIELNDDTLVKAIKCKLGLRKDTLGVTDLIPGLPVEVEVIHSGSALVALNVKFKADDLKTARQIQAGLDSKGQEMKSMQADQQAAAS